MTKLPEKTMTHQILSSNNKPWGFFGTASRFDRTSPEETWTLAFHAIRQATSVDDDSIRLFLDSRHGRHFADDVANNLCAGHSLKEAIDAATSRWMGWTISRRTSRDTGIPADIPYLTGFVMGAGVEAGL